MIQAEPVGFDEARWLEVAEAVVVDVVLEVAGAAGGADRAAELLRDRPFDGEGAQLWRRSCSCRR